MTVFLRTPASLSSTFIHIIGNREQIGSSAHSPFVLIICSGSQHLPDALPAVVPYKINIPVLRTRIDLRLPPSTSLQRLSDPHPAQNSGGCSRIDALAAVVGRGLVAAETSVVGSDVRQRAGDWKPPVFQSVAQVCGELPGVDRARHRASHVRRATRSAATLRAIEAKNAAL
jgi:hypothetical protein